MILVNLFKMKGVTAMLRSLTRGTPESETTVRDFIIGGAPLPQPQVDIESGGIRIGSARVAEEACKRERPGRVAGTSANSPQHRCLSIWKASNMNKRAEDSLGYNFRLYVAGQMPKSIAAICNLRRLCEKYLSGRYRLDVIDLMVDPNLAQRDQIIAVPTLVVHVPERVKRIIGDLSNSKRVLSRLGIDVSAKA